MLAPEFKDQFHPPNIQLPVLELVFPLGQANMELAQDLEQDLEVYHLGHPLLHLGLLEEYELLLLHLNFRLPVLHPELLQDLVQVPDTEMALARDIRQIKLPVLAELLRLGSTNTSLQVLHLDLVQDQEQVLVEVARQDHQVQVLGFLDHLPPLLNIRLPAHLLGFLLDLDPVQGLQQMLATEVAPLDHQVQDFLDHFPALHLALNHQATSSAVLALDLQEFQVVFPLLLLSLLTVAPLLPPHLQEHLPGQVHLGTNTSPLAFLLGLVLAYLLLLKEVLHLGEVREAQEGRANLLQDLLVSMLIHPGLPEFRLKMPMVVISINTCFLSLLVLW